MTLRSLQLHLGILACLVALFLTLIAIPQWVSSPSNVQFIILSPLFWPYTLAGLTGLTGILLLVNWKRAPENGELANEMSEDSRAAVIRLFAMALIMIVSMYLLPRLGMVWTCMLVFLSTAFLVRTRHPIAAVVCAVIVPLTLYAFFAHVAGVGIPQGDFVRLP